MRAIGSFGYSSSRTVTPIAPAPTEEIVTSTPSTAPVSTVSATVERGEYSLSPVHAHRKQAVAEQQRDRGQQQHHAEHGGDDVGGGGAGQVEMRNHQQCQRGRRHAAGGEAARRSAIPRCGWRRARRCRPFGDRGIEQIGADRGGRMNAKQQYQDRRHQRSATDAGLADQQSDQEAGDDIREDGPTGGNAWATAYSVVAGRWCGRRIAFLVVRQPQETTSWRCLQERSTWTRSRGKTFRLGGKRREFR